MKRIAESDGVRWGLDDRSYIHWWSESAEKWCPWDGDSDGPWPPDEIVKEGKLIAKKAAGSDAAHQVALLRWLIVFLVVVVIAIFAFVNLSKSDDAAERDAEMILCEAFDEC